MADRIAGVLSSLTDRQRECIVRVKKGLTSKEIARELGISPKTVELHISTAMQRLGVSSRLAVVSLLYDEELNVRDEFLLVDPDNGAAGSHVVADRAARPGGHSGNDPSARFLPLFGGSVNAVSLVQRVRWILLIALLCVMSACAFILSIVGVIAVADRLAS